MLVKSLKYKYEILICIKNIKIYNITFMFITKYNFGMLKLIK